MQKDDVFYGQIFDRNMARAMGIKNYFTGIPCKNGHVTERSITNGCSLCVRDKRKRRNDDEEYKEKRRRSDREKYWNDPEKARKKRRDFHYRNPDSCKESGKKWREKNKEHLLEYQRSWARNNPDKIKRRVQEYYKPYIRERYANDPIFKSQQLMRSQMRRYINLARENKTGRTSEMVGYSPEEFAENIQNKMQFGMHWNNMTEWHIDHKFPVSRFDFNDNKTDCAVVNSLDNLIPMWKSHNLDKSDKTLEEWLTEKGENSEEWRLYSRYL